MINHYTGLNLNSNKITGLADGTASTDAVNKSQLDALLPVDLSSEVSGTLPVLNGGTGLSSLGTAGQLLRVNTAGTALEYFTPSYPTGSGTANEFAYFSSSSTIASSSSLKLKSTGEIDHKTLISSSYAYGVIGFKYLGYVYGTGAIEITLPDLGSTGVRFSCLVRLVNGSYDTSVIIKIAGYYQGGASPYVTIGGFNIYSGPPVTVRSGYSGSSVKVWLGETTTFVNSYVFITDLVVHSVTSGYSFDTFLSGFSVALVSSFGTVSRGPYAYTTFEFNMATRDIVAYSIRNYITSIWDNTVSGKKYILIQGSSDVPSNIFKGYNYLRIDVGEYTAGKFSLHTYNYGLTYGSDTYAYVTRSKDTTYDVKITFGADSSGNRGIYIEKYDGSNWNNTHVVIKDAWTIDVYAPTDLSKYLNAFTITYTDTAPTTTYKTITNLYPTSGQVKADSGSASSPVVTFLADTDTGLFSPASDTLAITTAANERLRITSSGSVGIAVSSPAKKLEVLDSTSDQLRLTYTASSVYTDFKTDSSGDIHINPTGNSINLDVTKLKFKSTQLLYYDSSYVGTLLLSNGGSSLSHTAGSEGYYNTGLGINSLNAITTGYYNTALGAHSLNSLTTGVANTAIGALAGQACTTNFNVLIGYQAGSSLSAGSGANTIVGYFAGGGLSNASNSVILGASSGTHYYNGSSYVPLTSLSECIQIGNAIYSGASAPSNEIIIGYNVVGNGSNTVTIGNSSITKTFLKGKVGVNTTPLESMHLDGGLILGNTSGTNAGTIRWNGSDFEGYDGTTWKSLTGAGGLSGSGTANAYAVWTSSTALGTGYITDEIDHTKVSRIFSINVTNNYTSQFVGDPHLYIINPSSTSNTWMTLYFAEVVGSNYYGAIQLKKTSITNKTGELHFVTNNGSGDFNTRMVISSSGNVGIGTTSPSNKLEVSGQARIDGVLTVKGSGSTPFSTGTAAEFRLNNSTATASVSLFYNDSKEFSIYVDNLSSKAYSIADDLTHTIYIKDNASGAFSIKEGSNTLFSITTTNSAERVYLGNSSSSSCTVESVNTFITNGINRSVQTITSSSTVSLSNHVILCDATSGSITVTLPSSPSTGRELIILKIDSSVNTVTINGNGKTINGSSTVVLSSQYEVKKIIYSSSAWYIVN